MWMCQSSVHILCFHLKSCPVHSPHALTDFVLAAVPHFQTSPVTSAVCFYFQSEAWPKTRDARHWNLLYMEKYCKIISPSEAENCKRCLNRFPHQNLSSTRFLFGALAIFEVRQSRRRCVSVSVRPCVSKGKIKS